MITLYRRDEKDFTHDGLGVLDANIFDPVVEEHLNGMYTLSFGYPLFAPLGLQIEGESIIKADTPNGPQLFRVSRPFKSNGELEVSALHIFYDLTDNIIEDTNIVGKDGLGALSQLFQNTQYKHKFTFNSDIQQIKNARVVRRNPVAAIMDVGQDNSFLSRWGGEILRDNFHVVVNERIGKDRGIVIQDKKNLIGYEANVDWSTPVTRIMPKGFDGLLLPEKYVDSPLINTYVQPKIQVVEFPDIKAIKPGEKAEEGAVPLEEAYKLLREASKQKYEIGKIDQPIANYKINFVLLSQTDQYRDYELLEEVKIGDTIHVLHETEALAVTAQVIKYKFNPLSKSYIDVEIGNYMPKFANIKDKVDSLQDGLVEMEENFLQNAKDIATDLINSGFGGIVRVYPDRILIMDNADEAKAKRVWQWNINGFGYSSTGVKGPYGLAITMDGSIVADFIKVGTLSARLIKTGFNGINNDIEIGAHGLSVKGRDRGSMLFNAVGIEMKNEKNETIGSIGRGVGYDINGNPVITGIDYNSYNSSHIFRGWYAGFLTTIFDISIPGKNEHFRVAPGDIMIKGDNIALSGNVTINGKKV